MPRVIFTLGVGLAPQRRLERAHAGGVLLHGDSQVEKVVVRRCRAGVPARRRCRRGQHGGRERDDGVEKRRREIDHPCRDWNEGVIFCGSFVFLEWERSAPESGKKKKKRKVHLRIFKSAKVVE